ncbi:hypothetical protein SAMN05216275_116160 [Streptosporangium canum]|uniref:Uncharacterized protein n=1 Tax=Streptosporangium canum TaxID=324952 RepID=A0A1I3WI93_9ACTN|nr:hypothetical protein SAMN05216275_116160 [Streptosporangium canum]
MCFDGIMIRISLECHLDRPNAVADNCFYFYDSFFVTRVSVERAYKAIDNGVGKSNLVAKDMADLSDCTCRFTRELNFLAAGTRRGSREGPLKADVEITFVGSSNHIRKC